jgi:hypothetical protein
VSFQGKSGSLEVVFLVSRLLKQLGLSFGLFFAGFLRTWICSGYEFGLFGVWLQLFAA